MPTWTADAQDYARDAGYVHRLAGPLLELAGDLHGRRVLDLGCGDGALTEQLSAAGADVVGVDADASMVRATAKRGLKAVQADASRLTGIHGPFDIVLSNAVLHWVSDSEAVAAAVHRVLKPGGLFVAEAGGHGNVAAIRVALAAALTANGHPDVTAPDWWFPTPSQQTSVLEGAGFDVTYMALVPRPVELDSGIEPWLRNFCGDVLRRVGPDAESVLRDTIDLLRPVLQSVDGTWSADYVRLRFTATAVQP